MEELMPYENAAELIKKQHGTLNLGIVAFTIKQGGRWKYTRVYDIPEKIHSVLLSFGDDEKVYRWDCVHRKLTLFA